MSIMFWKAATPKRAMSQSSSLLTFHDRIMVLIGLAARHGA